MSDAPKKDRWGALADLFGLAASNTPIPEPEPAAVEPVVELPAPELPVVAAASPVVETPVTPAAVPAPPAPVAKKPRSRWDQLAAAFGLGGSEAAEEVVEAPALPPQPVVQRPTAPARPATPTAPPPAAAPAPPAARTERPSSAPTSAPKKRSFAAEIFGEVDPEPEPTSAVPPVLAELFKPTMPLEERKLEPIDDIPTAEPGEEKLGSDFDSGSDQPRRRRRRRGGRGRGRGREEVAEGTETPRDLDSIAEDTPQDFVDNDDSPRYVEPDEVDEPVAEGDQPAPRRDEGDAGGERRPRRRRRGRGGRGEGRTSEGRTSEGRSEGTRSGERSGTRPERTSSTRPPASRTASRPPVDEDDEDDDLDGPLPKITDEDDDDDHHDLGGDAEEGAGDGFAHKKIPTWLETVEVMIEANMANRSSRDDRGYRGGSRGGGGGRGRSGGGGRGPSSGGGRDRR